MRPRRIPTVVAVLVVIIAATIVLVRSGRLGNAHRPPDSGLIPVAFEHPEELEGRDEMEFLMLRDPRTNAIPHGIRRREALFASTLPNRKTFGRGIRTEGAVTELQWTERGPINVGGRTRAFAIDVAAPTTLIAGSVAGGLWKSTDDGASWSLRTAPNQLHGISCIAQDRRAGKTNVWYAGTGEYQGSTTNATRWGSLYMGDGIFKSTDGGDQWTLLPATSSGSPQTPNDFDFVINVATNPAAPAGEDHVYAATHGGIYRSTDGGASWSKRVSSFSAFTDVAVTSTGVVYAWVKTSTPQVWRSTDGLAWTNITPTGFPTQAGRIVIGLAPSNPNLVYFLVQGVGASSPQTNQHQLWKYTYLSGNGAGGGGAWENRGGTLPPGINTQGGYDMLVHVKPDDPNFVLIGGTDLYRSTDGFATANHTVIGGYPYWPNGPHHPDQHAGDFSPTNPNVYYSANDGGIQKVADVTSGSIDWTSLNNGYNVTQFYGVAIAPESGSDLILAGAQDNGTQLGNAPGASAWIMAFGGDGTIPEVAPLSDDRLYTQYQFGQMQRQNRDGSNLTDITPFGSANQLFLTPIALDPNQSTRLYYAAGITPNTSSRIWRNDDAPSATPTTGWVSLPSTEVGAGSGYFRRISAIAVSTENDANVLYYGTVDGLVMRVDDAHTVATVTNVTPPGLAGGTSIGGFVRSIAIDPDDSQKALVAFGNYNFQSVWYTADGGATWTDVEGNLAGATGPSVRAVTMFRIDGQLHVFLGTSIGVLSTTALDGASTIWVQEAADAIGNVLIAAMDYRESDRTLVVATHGRGAFSTRFQTAAGIGDPIAANRPRATLEQSVPNPARRAATIGFVMPRPGRASLRVYDVVGREVATLVDGWREAGRHEARFQADGRFAPGAYQYVLRTEHGVESRKLVLVR